ncbi:MAG: hypothetical protein AAFU77_02525 [Myxococcota bacterium]
MWRSFFWATFALMVGCTPSLQSTPVQSTVQIDGDAGEWAGAELTLLGESPFTMSLQHQDDSLFVYLATGDANALQKLSRMGMTLWLDDQDDETKMVGVRFEPNSMLLAKSGPVLKARELFLERVGLWPPSKPTPAAFEGAKSGLWVAEFRLPLEPEREDVRLALEILRPTTIDTRRRQSVSGAARGGVRPRRPLSRTTPRAGAAVSAPSKTKKPSAEPERIWFDVEGLDSF